MKEQNKDQDIFTAEDVWQESDEDFEKLLQASKKGVKATREPKGEGDDTTDELQGKDNTVNEKNSREGQAEKDGNPKLDAADDSQKRDNKELQKDITQTEEPEEKAKQGDRDEEPEHPEKSDKKDVSQQLLNLEYKTLEDLKKYKFKYSIPIKRKGTTITVDNLYELVMLAHKGADYTFKTQKLAKYKDLIEQFENGNFTNRDLNLITQIKRDPENVIKKLAKENNVDLIGVEPDTYKEPQEEVEYINTDTDGTVSEAALENLRYRRSDAFVNQMEETFKEHLSPGVYSEIKQSGSLYPGLINDYETGVYNQIISYAVKSNDPMSQSLLNANDLNSFLDAYGKIYAKLSQDTQNNPKAQRTEQGNAEQNKPSDRDKDNTAKKTKKRSKKEMVKEEINRKFSPQNTGQNKEQQGVSGDIDWWKDDDAFIKKFNRDRGRKY